MSSDNYFLKLNKTFTPTKTAEPGEITASYGYTINNKFIGISYKELESQKDFCMELLGLNNLNKRFTLELLEVNYQIPPHTDSNVKCVINFYIETNNCTTCFYNAKPNASTMQIKNQTNGVIYKYDEVEKQCEFKAEPGDIYLLDVTKIHSVEPDSPGLIYRSALCLSSLDLEFEELKSELKSCF